MEFELAEVAISKEGVQHFHVTVGPDEVNLFNQPGMTYLGPLYSVDVDDVDDAARLWYDTVRSFTPDYFEEVEGFGGVEQVIEDCTHQSWDDDEWLYFYAEVEPFVVSIMECWGCVPAHTN